MALAEAFKEAIWLRGLVNEIGIKQESILIHCDSQSVICLAKNQVCHARTKHIVVMYPKIRDWVATGEISVEKIHTNENAADMLTKLVTTEKFRHCLDLLNLSSC